MTKHVLRVDRRELGFVSEYLWLTCDNCEFQIGIKRELSKALLTGEILPEFPEGLKNATKMLCYPLTMPIRAQLLGY